jgi:hypothetical protein
MRMGRVLPRPEIQRYAASLRVNILPAFGDQGYIV